MNIPVDLYYTNDHEWVHVSGNEAVFGITDYAQSELGDIVFLDLPAVGAAVKQGEKFGDIEAVKAAAGIYAPVSGTVVAVNGDLEGSPEIINQSPYEQGWIVRVKIADQAELKKLLTADSYKTLLASPEGA